MIVKRGPLDGAAHQQLAAEIAAASPTALDYGLMRDLPEVSVFSRDEARALGWSDAALTRAARAGRIVRIRRGFYSATPSTEVAAAQAAVRAIRSSAIGDRSALLTYRLPVVGGRPERPELTVPPNGTGDARIAHLRRAAMPAEHLRVVDGLPVLTPARTVVDVARHFPVLTSVPALDAAMQRGLATSDEIDNVVIRCWNWPGIGRGQRAIRLADPRAESALESVSRLVIARLHLPSPDLQPTVLDQYGRVIGRLDFYWDEYGVTGEADGRLKYDDTDDRSGRDVLIAEKERQELLEDAGMVFVRWGWQQVFRQPQLLRARIEAAFARGAARDRSGLPRLWSIVPAEPSGPRANVIDGG